MNQAKDLDEWREAMRMQSFASFNFVAADASGNIMFVHNSLTPQRAPGYDWSQYLPGDDSSLIWRDVVPFDELPQVVNPASGWVMSANQSPFRVTAEGDNPDPANFPATAGYQARMTNRAYRGMELLDQLGPISAAEFYAIKHDKSYSRALEIDYSDNPQLHAAQTILRNWDLTTDIDNRGAALGVCLVSSEWSAEQRGDPAPAVGPQFETCVALLQDKFGRIDPEWGLVNRHIRGTVNLPVGGGPDILRAIYGNGLEKDGYLTNVAGDGLYYLVSWDAQGKLSVQGIHHFGSATLDETSPHFSDQAPLYAREELRDPLFSEDKLMANLSHSYKP
jgi:penicillin amidase/acyl-homoserine-lactone acylase